MCLGTSSSLTLPITGTSAYLGVWVAGARTLTEIMIDGVDAISSFIKSSGTVTVAGVAGTLYVSTALLRADLSGKTIILR